MTAEFLPGPTTPGERIVAHADDLARAITELGAGAGGTILLDAAGGPYDIALHGVGRSAAPVTITARDPAHPPEIASLKIENSAGLIFRDLEFRTGTIDRQEDVIVLGSRDIVFTGNTMTGRADGFVDGTGSATSGDSLMFVRNSADIEISDNVISHYYHGLGILDNTGLTITGNEISHIQGDGVRGGGISSSTISGNYMHSFFGTLQSINHTDMIQLWGSSTRSLNRDVTIADNVLLAGTGMATQTILLLNERFGADGPEGGYFQNITITGNLIHNGATHGIYAAHVDGLRVTDNTVLWNRDAVTIRADGSGGGSMPWINVRQSPDAVIDANVVGRITLDRADGTLHATNAILDYTDVTSPRHVDRHIVTLMPDDLLDARNFELRADSPYHGTHGAAPDLPWLAGRPPIPTIDHAVRPGTLLAVDLDADIFGAGGQFLDPATLGIRWRLEDGTVLAGERVTWAFDTPGTHTVHLEITDAAARTVTRDHRITLADPTLARIDFEDGVADGSTRAAAVKTIGAPTLVAGSDGDQGFALSADSRFALLRENAQLYGLDRFEIAMDLKRAADWQPGTVMELYRTLGLRIEKDGAIGFSLFTDEGRYSLHSGPDILSDGGWHDLVIRYDDSAGTLALDLDGVTLDSVAASGRTSTKQFWNLDMGASWGTTARVDIDDLEISSPDSAAARAALARDIAPDIGPGPDDLLFHFDFDGDIVDKSDHGTAASLRGGADRALVADGRSEGGFRLTDATSFEIDRGAQHLSSLDSFHLDFDLRLAAPGAAGGLLTLHTILNLDLRADGSLGFWLKTESGKFRLNTDKGVLDDTGWHDMDIVYADGGLSLLVDGIEQASTAAHGTTPKLTYWGFALGDPWGANVDAVIDDFRMRVPAADPLDPDWLL